MSKVKIVTPETAGRTGEALDSSGANCFTYLGGEGTPLHLRRVDLGPGSHITFRADEAACALYVWTGSVTAGERELRERSSAFLECGAELAVCAGNEGASILSFATRDGAERRPGGKAYLLPVEHLPLNPDLDGTGRSGGALHADATLPACPLWMHENDFHEADFEVAVHSHSEDEIIFVRTGAIRLGNRLYGPGTALAIASNTKYGFHAGPQGLGFVNFRAASPTYSSADGTTVMDEANLWRSLTGKPSYVAPSGG